MDHQVIVNGQGRKEMRLTDMRFENDVHLIELTKMTSSCGLTDRLPFRNKAVTPWFHSKAFLVVLDFLLHKGDGEAPSRGRASHESFLPFVLLDFGPAWCLPSIPILGRSSIQCR